MRQGGKQLEVNNRSVGERTRFGVYAVASCLGEGEAWKSRCALSGDKRHIDGGRGWGWNGWKVRRDKRGGLSREVTCERGQNPHCTEDTAALAAVLRS